MNDNKDYITHPDEKGTINISEEVIAAIAASAVAEIEGVASLPSNIGKDIAELLGGKKNIARGVRIQSEDGEVIADVCIMVKLGYPVNEVGAAAQEKAMAAIESMTGFAVKAVNVHICGVALDK
ncbi:MAG: Asp23/Gls24 family envelope stress response protein [Oscillospiraceae bacterium]